ncbi:MAG: hypothetical protein AAF634_12880 [Bacteroidota bacterium]
MTGSKGQHLLYTAIVAFLGLLLLTAFSSSNACEYAQNNTHFFKKQTQYAMAAKSFDKAKYHAYKALNGIYKTKANFKDCGCDTALKTVGNAEKSLKDATKAPSFEDAGVFLHIALKNIGLTLNALESLDHQYTEEYRDDVLVLNTLTDRDTLLDANHQLHVIVEESLSGFKRSLIKVVALEECTAAKQFLQSTLETTRKALTIPTLTEAQRHYHNRVNTLAYEALSELENCPKK